MKTRANALLESLDSVPVDEALQPASKLIPIYMNKYGKDLDSLHKGLGILNRLVGKYEKQMDHDYASEYGKVRDALQKKADQLSAKSKPKESNWSPY